MRLHVGDVDDELVGHVGRGGSDLDRVDGRVDQAAFGETALASPSRRSGTDTVISSFMLTWRKSMWLTVRLIGWRCMLLDDGRVALAVDLERQHGVRAGRAAEGEAQLATLDG